MKTFLFLTALLLVFAACRSKKPALVIWTSADPVKYEADFASFNTAGQIAALVESNPENEAEREFAKGDHRFFATRYSFPDFIGVTNDAFTQGMIKRNGYKLIGVSLHAETNKIFLNLKKSYEERFNHRLQDLLRAADK